MAKPQADPGGGDERTYAIASVQLAQEWANLEPVVAPECADALDRVARQLLNLRFASAEDALPPCRNSVSS